MSQAFITEFARQLGDILPTTAAKEDHLEFNETNFKKLTSSRTHGLWPWMARAPRCIFPSQRWPTIHFATQLGCAARTSFEVV